MSPALKAAVPIGSFDAHVLESKEPQSAIQQQLSLTSAGWKCSSFRSSADQLSSASSRLEREAERESKYWRQVASLTKQGWAVSRLPRDNKAIGVHFGFAEAASQFRSRGFALLRQNDEGNVYLDGNMVLEKPKILKISILRNGTTTASFFQAQSTSKEGDAISQQLKNARQSLFDEELFYEASREARVAANQGITTRSQSLDVDVGGQYTISIALVGHDTAHSNTSKDDETLAEFISLALRALLTEAHKENYTRRTRTPEPLSLKPKFVPEYNLLRPLVGHLRHNAELSWFQDRFSPCFKALRMAGLEVQLRDINLGPEERGTDLQTPSAYLAKPAVSKFSVNLPTGRTLTISITTQLSAPIYGTQFVLEGMNYTFTSMNSKSINDHNRLVSVLTHLLTIDVIAYIETLNGAWKVKNPHNGEMEIGRGKELSNRISLSVLQYAFALKTLGEDKLKQKIWIWSERGYSSAREDERLQDTTSKKLTEVLDEINS